MKEQKNGPGKKFDSEKLRFDLIPEDVMEKYAETYTHGVAKYEEENWRKGFSYKRIYGSIKRHINRSIRGEDIDPDSGCLHLAQVMWGCATLIHQQLQGTGIDDRAIDLIESSLQIIPGNRHDIKEQTKMFWEIFRKLKEKQNEETREI